MWVANGTIDIPALCLSIWGFYFFIKGFEKSKLFILSIVLIVLSGFAKYTSFINFVPMFFYLLSKNNFKVNIKNNIKNIILGFIISFILILPFINFYITNNVFKIFSSYSSGVYTNSTISTSIPLNDYTYYIYNLPQLFFRYNTLISMIFIVFLVIGILYGVYKLCKIGKFSKLNLTGFILSSIGIISSFLLTINNTSLTCLIVLYLSLILFTLSFKSIYSNTEYLNYSYDLLMFTWFLGHFIFLSAYLIKAHRYSIAFIPPLIFTITYGFKTIQEHFNKKYITLILIVFLLILSFGHLTIDKTDSWVADEKTVSQYIESNNTFENLTIWADRPSYAWYTKMDIHSIEEKGNLEEFSKKLLENNVDIYISHEPQLNIKNYKITKEFGSIVFYTKCNI